MVMQMVLICTPWYHIHIITWNWEKKKPLICFKRESIFFLSLYNKAKEMWFKNMWGKELVLFSMWILNSTLLCLQVSTSYVQRNIFKICNFSIHLKIQYILNITFLIYYSDNYHFIFRTHFTSFVICFILMF